MKDMIIDGGRKFKSNTKMFDMPKKKATKKTPKKDKK